MNEETSEQRDFKFLASSADLKYVKEIAQSEEIICVGCEESFPEDMINKEDEPLCEECYIQQGADRAEQWSDLD